MIKLRKKATVARRVRRQHTGAFKAQVPCTSRLVLAVLLDLIPQHSVWACHSPLATGELSYVSH